MRYPRRFGAGELPRTVLLGGIARLLVWGVIGFVVLPIVVEVVWRIAGDVRTDGGIALLALLVAFAAVPTVMGVYVAVRIVDGALRTWRGAYDLGHQETTEGAVVKVYNSCVAVDDGRSRELVALPVRAPPVPHQGDRVRVTFTPKLHHVQAISAGGAP